MMNSREILEFITDNEKVTLSKLSQLMGIKRAQPLYDIRDGKIKAISANYADKILSVFPEYSRAWLITGEGQPFSKNENEVNLSDLTKRFVRTYKEMGLTGYRMGKECSSITKQKISNIEKGITEVTTDILADFALAYDNVNANYILTGKGEMFLSEDNKPVDNLSTSQSQDLYESIIIGKDKEIEELKNEINRLIGENSIMREQLGIGKRKPSTKSA